MQYDELNVCDLPGVCLPIFFFVLDMYVFQIISKRVYLCGYNGAVLTLITNITGISIV